MPMKLLTQEVIARLPRLYSQDGKDPKDVPIVCKFFTPDSSWTWYVTEGDGYVGDDGKTDYQFFGLVHGLETELGYFCLSELAEATGPFGLHIERDMHFDSKATLDSVLRKEGLGDLADSLGKRTAA